METLLTFFAILFLMILIIVASIDVCISMIRYHDFSGMPWKSIGKMALFFAIILILGCIVNLALELTMLIVK